MLEATILVYLYAESSNPEMSMMWIFPYFFEPRILECLPSFTMLDYQVGRFNQLIKVITREVKTALGDVNVSHEEDLRLDMFFFLYLFL